MQLTLLFLGSVYASPAAFLPAMNVSAESGHLLKRNTIVDEYGQLPLDGFRMPAYPYKTSKIFGDTAQRGKFSDFMSTFAGRGEDKKDTIRYRLSGIQGRCGRRVDAIAFKYKDKSGRQGDLKMPLRGGGGGALNPDPKTGREWEEIDVDNGEYVQSVDVRVCKKDANQICYLAFNSNQKARVIWECGRREEPIWTSTNSMFKEGGALAYVQGYADHELYQIQLVWVPGPVYGSRKW